MGLGRTPHDAGLVQRRVDIGERGRTEIEDVVGELLLLELITAHRGNTRREQHPSGELCGRTQHGQRAGALVINVEGEQRAHLRTDQGYGFGTSGHRGFPHFLRRSPQQLADMDLFDTALHPWPERGFHAIGQHQCVLSKPTKIIVRGTGWSRSGRRIPGLVI